MYNRAVSDPQAIDFFNTSPAIEAILSLFDELPMAQLYIKDYRGDTGGTFLFVNEQSWRSKQLASAEEMIGRTDYDFHPAALARQYRAEDEAVLISRKPVRQQPWLIIDQAGAATISRSSKYPVYEMDGSPKGIVGVRYQVTEAEETSGHFNGVTRALVHVQQHLEEKLILQTLADLAGYSVSRFGVVFRQLMNESPGDYIKRMRVYAAARQLEETDFTVGEIAQRCGFYDHSHFSRQFKEVLGLSPTRYRSGQRE